ncbi:aspartate aminotransferase family protein [Actinoplanes subglobosus]|uniref:Aspartate aminotransferase family protein n=1 Tax=Actinoplanes subglobosus TaxID=1547892 RepID=A0ABV8J5T4_9ACTN
MITEALNHVHRRYADKHPNSARQHRLSRTVLPAGISRSVLNIEPFPLAVASASGSLLTDIDGNDYLDYLGDYSVGLAGHNPEAVSTAVTGVLESGWALGAVTVEEYVVARMLCDRIESMDLVRFTASGTEANLLAVSLALRSSGRRSVLVFDGGYHGGFLDYSHDSSSLNVPFDVIVCDYNNLDAVTATFETAGEQIGCVLVEPMLGAAGRIPGSPIFLQGLREICDRYGTVLVFDEVQTSRMAYGAAQSLLGVRPDLTTLGKYLAAGFGFGAVGGTASLMRRLDHAAQPHYAHSGTFNNNRFSMAAAIATLNTTLTRDNLDLLFVRGENLRVHADTLLRPHGFQATGWGSLISIHPTTTPITHAADLAGADQRLTQLLFHEMLHRGIYIGKTGFVTLCLPQTADADGLFLTTLKDALAAIPTCVKPSTTGARTR